MSLPPLDLPANNTPALIPFVKAHANGNDFLILEESVTNRNHAALARKLCHRTKSVGADGIEFLHRRPDGSLFIRLFNSDGSEAELSGNGTRCVAAWLAATEQLNQVTLQTHGGPRACEIVKAHDPHFLIRTDMGSPRVLPSTIEIQGPSGHPIQIPGAIVNVGNPHFVILLSEDAYTLAHPEDFSAHGLPWQQLGELISASPLFSHSTNVEFVRILSPTEIAFRIYERGCGPTQSSGTGTCASSAAAMSLRNTSRTLTAYAEGGPQQVDWAALDSPMYLTGPAEIICRGEASAALTPEEL